MNILFMTRLFYPHIGGVETHVFKVAKCLIEKGNNVNIITELSDSRSKQKEEYKGITIYRIPKLQDNWFKKFQIWGWLFNHRALLKTADIVHCHDIFFWFVLFRFLYPDKKVFTTFHGYETHFPVSKKAIVMRKISEMLSRGNICIGDYISKYYGTKPTYTLYGGVDEVKPFDISQGKQSSTLKILFIGRLEEDNGVSVYANVLKLLKDEKILFEFEAVGDGSHRKIVEQYGKVYGFIENVEDYILRADLVFSSSYLSILQTMNLKKPVISVYSNELKKDYLYMTPFSKWLIISDSPVDILREIKQYVKTKSKKNAEIQKAYEYVQKNTWGDVANIYLSLWNT